MSDGDEESRVRYDRQVRLWGSATQRRLQRTTLLLLRAGGSEVAKNLVLGGVGAVRVFDDAAVSAADVRGSSVFAQCEGRRRDESAVDGLRQLNHLVDVATAATPAAFDAVLAAGGDALVLVYNSPMAEVRRLVGAMTTAAQRVVAVFSSAEEALCLVLSQGDAAAFDTLVGSAPFLARRPLAYQRPLALWHAFSAAAPAASHGSASPLAALPFPALLTQLIACRDHLGLATMDDAAVERCAQQADKEESVLINSVTGGVLCQQLIAAMAAMPVDGQDGQATVAGSAAAGTVFDWAVVRAAPSTGTECLVGTLSD
jgi:hypothetical protein